MCVYFSMGAFNVFTCAPCVPGVLPSMNLAGEQLAHSYSTQYEAACSCRNYTLAVLAVLVERGGSFWVPLNQLIFFSYFILVGTKDF